MAGDELNDLLASALEVTVLLPWPYRLANAFWIIQNGTACFTAFGGTLTSRPLDVSKTNPEQLVAVMDEFLHHVGEQARTADDELANVPLIVLDNDGVVAMSPAAVRACA